MKRDGGRSVCIPLAALRLDLCHPGRFCHHGAGRGADQPSELGDFIGRFCAGRSFINCFPGFLEIRIEALFRHIRLAQGSRDKRI